MGRIEVASLLDDFVPTPPSHRVDHTQNHSPAPPSQRSWLLARCPNETSRLLRKEFLRLLRTPVRYLRVIGKSSRNEAVRMKANRLSAFDDVLDPIGSGHLLGPVGIEPTTEGL